jgi:hypothetical protein
VVIIILIGQFVSRFMKKIIRKLLILNSIGIPLMLIYLGINYREDVSHFRVLMPEWVPFFPEMALVYLAMLVVPMGGQLLLRDQVRFYRSLGAFVVGFFIIAIIWVVYPTVMMRPDSSATEFVAIYNWMISVDRPVNILPCGHILWPVIIVYFLWQERPEWFWALISLLVIGGLSIVTTWQHRPVDVFIGGLIAWLAIRVSEKFPLSDGTSTETESKKNTG